LRLVRNPSREISSAKGWKLA